MENNNISIKFTSDINQRIINYILKFGLEYLQNNVNNYLTDGFTKNINQNDEYELMLKPVQGTYNLVFKENNIELIYTKSNNFKATAEEIKFYEELILKSDNKEVLLDFIEEARKKNANPEKNDKLLCRILKPGGMWGLLSKVHKRADNTLFMNIDLKEEILNNIEEFFKDEDDYLKHGIPFKMNFLFHGLPGAGKTSLIYTIASYFSLDICYLNITKDLDDNTFTRAITSLPEDSILVLEDLDALFVERESKSCLSFSTVLNVLDGIIKKHKLLTFITTNHKDRLDSALKRSGRIDYELEFTYASRKQTENMFKHFFEDNQLKEFMKFTKKLKYTTADLQRFLFKYRKTDNIMNHIETFTEIINKNVEKTPDNLYI